VATDELRSTVEAGGDTHEVFADGHWLPWSARLLVGLRRQRSGSGLRSPEGAPTTKGTFTALVSFGDSLSDVGAYAPATSLTGNGAPPYFGGKFTTNSATGTVWVENLATSLGLLVTPAEVGFAGQSVKCPAAAVNAALAGTCTGYGQGGSRVTDPNGIGKAGGALTVPVKTQIANHLARFGSFKASDLIVVFAGNNDAFVQFGIFSAAATKIQADAAAGRITRRRRQPGRLPGPDCGPGRDEEGRPRTGRAMSRARSWPRAASTLPSGTCPTRRSRPSAARCRPRPSRC
jgi:hypothetical protein